MSGPQRRYYTPPHTEILQMGALLRSWMHDPHLPKCHIEKSTLTLSQLEKYPGIGGRLDSYEVHFRHEFLQQVSDIGLPYGLGLKANEISQYCHFNIRCAVFDWLVAPGQE